MSFVKWRNQSPKVGTGGLPHDAENIVDADYEGNLNEKVSYHKKCYKQHFSMHLIDYLN